MESLSARSQVGQYILEDKLGEGGMAEVWRARNAVLGHSAAIKFLTPRFAGHPEVEHRFLEEGKRQAQLQHPNIVAAFDFLYVDDRSFLVMRYIKGQSLDSLLLKLRAPMTLPDVLSISGNVLGALGYAHSEGVVHRDIKPSNILVDNNGVAYVLDFGIALALGQQRVTRAGTAIGTPHYMSPEQIVGSKDLDHRSDIYSYGCVLYQMLTERPPFDFKEGEGDTEYFVKDQHLRQPAGSLRELNPNVPENIERVVLRCLAKKPSDRFGNCQELLDALSEAPSERRPYVTFPTPTRLESADTLGHGWQSRSPAVTEYSPGPPPPQQEFLTGTRTNLTPAPPVPASGRRSAEPILLAAAGIVAIGLASGYYFFSHRNEPTPNPGVRPVVKEDASKKGTDSNSTADKRETLPEESKEVQPAETKQTGQANPPRLPKPKDTALYAGNLDTHNRLQSDDTHSIPVTPPKPGPPAQTVAQSGVLRCPGSPIPQRGKVVFTVPNKLLHYDYDKTKWFIHSGKSDGAYKVIELISLEPGVQTSCEIPWRVQE